MANNNLKTVRGYLIELPEEFRGKALKNMINPDLMVDSLSEALGAGLKKWETTPEGHDYWQVLFFNLRKAEPEKALRIPENQTIPPGDLINMKKVLEFNSEI